MTSQRLSRDIIRTKLDGLHKEWKLGSDYCINYLKDRRNTSTRIPERILGNFWGTITYPILQRTLWKLSGWIRVKINLQILDINHLSFSTDFWQTPLKIFFRLLIKPLNLRNFNFVLRTNIPLFTEFVVASLRIINCWKCIMWRFRLTCMQVYQLQWWFICLIYHNI